MMKKSEEKKRKVGSLVLVRMKRVKMEKGGLCIHTRGSEFNGSHKL